eukprot:TRINITY_DN7045_c0_g1_i1.p1 TRINITY_DN7045_c0_g1~~TRINITY_DN7045_c0_g1_i1.p1  ORF type:complete len:352 (-),score=42.46 TRINITY_DN7045_c0_g1_i1:50-1105(-)
MRAFRIHRTISEKGGLAPNTNCNLAIVNPTPHAHILLHVLIHAVKEVGFKHVLHVTIPSNGEELNVAVQRCCHHQTGKTIIMFVEYDSLGMQEGEMKLLRLLLETCKNVVLVLYSERQFDDEILQKIIVPKRFLKFNMDCSIPDPQLDEYIAAIKRSGPTSLNKSKAFMVGNRASAMAMIDQMKNWEDEIIKHVNPAIKSKLAVQLLEKIYKDQDKFKVTFNALRQTIWGKFKHDICHVQEPDKKFREILGEDMSKMFDRSKGFPNLNARDYLRQINTHDGEIYTWEDVVEMADNNPLMWLEEEEGLVVAPLLLIHWALIRPSKRTRVSDGTKSALKDFLHDLPTTVVGAV